jgi:hypothetical protein
MLYPLSYEGLIYAFAQHAGEWWSVGPGLAASLLTVCANLCRVPWSSLSLPFRPAALIVRRWCRAQSRRTRCDGRPPCFGHGSVGASG